MCNTSSIASTMSGSCADFNAGAANVMKVDSASGRKMHTGFVLMRNSSSLSTQSSEFEFDSHSSDLNDEPPVSPKLLFSPNYTPNYSPNLFPDGETASRTSANQYCADRDTFHVSNTDYLRYGASSLKEKSNQEIRDADSEQSYGITSSFSRARSESEIRRCNGQRSDNADDKQETRGKFDSISEVNFSVNHNYEAPATGLRANFDTGKRRRRTNLGSLLNRRDVEQLPPLTNYNHQFKNDIRHSSASSSNSASVSPSSSPLNYPANHSSNPSKFEEDHPDYAGDTKSCHRKNRKWTFRLDFLKKGPSPRADQSVNQSGSNDKQADYSPNHGLISNQSDHYGAAAATDENYLSRDRNYNTTVTAEEPQISRNNQLMQRVEHFRAAADAAEARFNRQINQSLSMNYRAGAGARDGARMTQQINQSITNGGAGVISKLESPRQSISSMINSSVSTLPLPRHALTVRNAENHVIKADYRKISKSAPISPAGSPPRSPVHGGDGGFTRRQAPMSPSPMSPHAAHYEKQRARADELRRKTFLPYRQSLLGACFSPQPHPQQIVY